MTTRRCVKKKRYNGVLRCAKFTTTRRSSCKGPCGCAGCGTKKRKTAARRTGASRNTKMFWLDRSYCLGERSGFPKGYSAKGLKCNRKLPHRGGRWPSVTEAAKANRTARARRVSW